MKQTGKARIGFLAIVSLVVVLLVASGGVVADDGTHSSDNSTETTNEGFCDFENPEWRDSQTIAGVDIAEERVCQPDNPNTVAAVTKGTNNVPKDVLKKTGLDEKTVIKKNDRDGDGDPDEIHIYLEVMGVNEHDRNAVNYSIAPGIKPSFWVFAPKTNGMVEDGSKASKNIRMPSPTIRAEEGDTVYIHVENTHYMPHTIHFHGTDHPYESETGGNDGVPQTSEKPIMPGESRTYKVNARQAGTMFYHCHVVPNVHVKMGLNGMFVITEESDNNTVQTLNIGAGKVRSPSNTMDEEFDGEYDLVYQEVDKKMVNIPNTDNMSAAEISYKMHRKYDATDAKPDYFMLNGKSFPSTVKESLINVEPNKEYHFNVLNAGSKTYSIHPHGHKFTITAYDGVELNESQRIQRDVLSLTAAQRVDFTLNTTDNGLESYGSGVWFFHDHDEKGVTNDGISPGGTVTLIAYDEYVQEDGTPITNGVPLTYYDKAYYNGEKPILRGEKYKWDEAFEDDTSDDYSQYQNTTTPHNDSHSDDGHHSSGDSGGMMGGMMMDMKEVENGTIVNENTDNLPAGCTEISGTETLTIDAGTKYADDGQIFSYDREKLEFDKCSKVTVTLNNTDDVRHQWMIHGLPMDTYPMGMFNIEADSSGEVTATFITPGTDTTLNIHCSLPTHEEMGMQQTLVIGEGGSNSDGHHSGDTTTEGTGDGHDHTHDPSTTEAGGQQPSLVEFGAVVAVLALLGGGIAVLAMRYRD